jgi:hypothetical protein
VEFWDDRVSPFPPFTRRCDQNFGGTPQGNFRIPDQYREEYGKTGLKMLEEFEDARGIALRLFERLGEDW